MMRRAASPSPIGSPRPGSSIFRSRVPNASLAGALSIDSLQSLVRAESAGIRADDARASAYDPGHSRRFERARMTRLRYPFAEIGLRCRLCNTTEYIDASGGQVGARIIDWRRRHALVCQEWPRWATRKGLVLDQNGALLYPGEIGPFVPRGDRRNGRARAHDLLQLPN